MDASNEPKKPWRAAKTLKSRLWKLAAILAGLVVPALQLYLSDLDRKREREANDYRNRSNDSENKLQKKMKDQKYITIIEELKKVPVSGSDVNSNKAN